MVEASLSCFPGGIDRVTHPRCTYTGRGGKGLGYARVRGLGRTKSWGEIERKRERGGLFRSRVTKGGRGGGCFVHGANARAAKPLPFLSVSIRVHPVVVASNRSRAPSPPRPDYLICSFTTHTAGLPGSHCCDANQRVPATTSSWRVGYGDGGGKRRLSSEVTGCQARRPVVIRGGGLFPLQRRRLDPGRPRPCGKERERGERREARGSRQ